MSKPATDDNVRTLTLPAAAGLTSTDQFKFVEMASTGLVSVCNAATDLVVGVLYGNLPLTPAVTVAGDPVTVAVGGKVLVKAAAAIAAAGVFGATSTGGRLQTGVATNRVAGLIASTASEIDEMTEVILNGPGAILP
jgi:hypothetical protein